MINSGLAITCGHVSGNGQSKLYTQLHVAQVTYPAYAVRVLPSGLKLRVITERQFTGKYK